MKANQHNRAHATHVRVKQSIYHANGALQQQFKSINAAKRASRQLSISGHIVICEDKPPALRAGDAPTNVSSAA
jgi:hypothetical protein